MNQAVLPMLYGGFSPLWNQIRVFCLTENMRLRNPNLTYEDLADMAAFAQSLLDVSDGTTESLGRRDSAD